MKFAKLLGAFAVAATMGASASAADLPSRKAAVAPAPVFVDTFHPFQIRLRASVVIPQQGPARPAAGAKGKPEGDKIIRASTASAQIEAGRLYLPEDAPWLADFEHELVTFPNGRHDDQVDAHSQFLNWSRHRTSSEDQQTWVCFSTILDDM